MLSGRLHVLIVKLPDLPAKGDVSDWLDAGGSAEKLHELVIQAAATAETVDADDEEEKAERESQVDKLVRFAKEHFHLLHDKNNDAFAQHKQTGIVSRLNGRQFRDSLDPVPAGGIETGCHDTRFWSRQTPAQLAFIGEALAAAPMR